ncbi:MAG TPA: alpha/beta fold hydrolase [Burkholderiales bacterium]|nr:alpha/beta fold hydrolase [Burkholderiales bacterium]
MELLFDRAAGEPRALCVLGHGAGGHKADRAMSALAPVLAACGLDVVRFDFPYRSRGSRRPDPMPALQAAFVEAVAQARREHPSRRLVIGGRSMGGRAASMLAAQGFACDALLLFAYPLHPEGTPEKLRDAHLPAIRVPVLCMNGTRDRLCRRDLMERVVEKATRSWRMRWLEGAGHSFAALPPEAVQEIRGWLAGL